MYKCRVRCKVVTAPGRAWRSTLWAVLSSRSSSRPAKRVPETWSFCSDLCSRATPPPQIFGFENIVPRAWCRNEGFVLGTGVHWICLQAGGV